MYVQATFFPGSRARWAGSVGQSGLFDPAAPVPRGSARQGGIPCHCSPPGHADCEKSALSAWRAGRGRGVGGSTGGRLGAGLASLASFGRPYGIGPRYAVLSALCGGSVCGRARGRSVDGRGGWKQGIRRTDLHDCHHPTSDPIPALERKIDVHAWMKTLSVDLLHVAVVLMHTPAGHQEPCVALGISEETLSELKIRLIASWRAFNR
jgi:hypothetical protein